MSEIDQASNFWHLTAFLKVFGSETSDSIIHLKPVQTTIAKGYLQNASRSGTNRFCLAAPFQPFPQGWLSQRCWEKKEHGAKTFFGIPLSSFMALEWP